MMFRSLQGLQIFIQKEPQHSKIKPRFLPLARVTVASLVSTWQRTPSYLISAFEMRLILLPMQCVPVLMTAFEGKGRPPCQQWRSECDTETIPKEGLARNKAPYCSPPLSKYDPKTPKGAQSAFFLKSLLRMLDETEFLTLNHSCLNCWISMAEIAIGDQFLASYYQIFDTNRAALGALYVSFQKANSSQIVNPAD